MYEMREGAGLPLPTSRSPWYIYSQCARARQYLHMLDNLSMRQSGTIVPWIDVMKYYLSFMDRGPPVKSAGSSHGDSRLICGTPCKVFGDYHRPVTSTNPMHQVFGLHQTINLILPTKQYSTQVLDGVRIPPTARRRIERRRRQ